MFLFLFLLLVFWCGVGTISQINFVVVVVVLSFSSLLRLLFFVCSFFDLVGSQSRVGDRLLRIGVVSRQNGTAVCLESVHLCLFLCETVAVSQEKFRPFGGGGGSGGASDCNSTL